MVTSPLPAQLRPRVRGVFARAFTASWLLFQVTVAAAVPVVDAQADHADRVVAHWEDASDTTCPPLHDLSGCQLCQQVTASGRAPSARSLLPAPTLGSEMPSVDVQSRVPRPVVVGALTARAPPVR